MKKISPEKYKGFSLAESMIALVILGFAASAATVPFSSGSRVRAEGMRRTLAVSLADDMMEQVLNCDFDSIINNYNYSEAKGFIKNYQSVKFADSRYSKFSRKVSSQKVYVSQEDGSFDPKFIRVTVSVYYDGKEMVTIDRLITR